MLRMYLKYQSIGKYFRPSINLYDKLKLKGLFITFGQVWSKLKLFLKVARLNMGPGTSKTDFVVCKKQGHRSFCAFGQSYQCLCFLISGKYDSYS